MIANILVVCIGNICRSPMAEGLFKHALPGITVRSAGLDAMTGHPADPFAVQLMQEQGIDITGHRAQALASWMISEADIVVAMDLAQKHFIEQRYPTARGKVFRLCESDNGDINGDIPDPYRQGLAVFRQTCDLIVQGVDVLVERIDRIR